MIDQTAGGAKGFTKSGSGTLVLTATSLYTGDTNVNAGVLKIDSTGALSTPTTYRVNGGILEIGTFGSGNSLDRPIFLNSGGLRANRTAATTTGTFGSVVTVGNTAGTVVTLSTATAAQSLTLITGAANGLTGGASDSVINVLGPGTISLNTNSNYVGKWRISGGTLSITGDQANLGTAPGAPVADYITMDGGAFSSANSSLVTNRGFTTTSNGGTFSLSGTSDGSIAGIITGPGSLFKVNTGSLTLGNSNNAYQGSTSVLGGWLVVASGGPLGTAPNSPTDNLFLNAGTLLFTGSVTGVPLSANRRVVLGPIGGAGTGTIDIADTKTVRIAGDIKNNTGGTGTLGKAGLGTLILEGDGLYTGTTHISAGTLQLGNGGAGGSLGAGNVTDSAALSFNRSNALNVANNIDGSGSVNQNGTGVTTLSGTNSYTGVTRVTAGTLKLGSASALGTAAGATSVTTGATLDLNGQNISGENISSIAGAGVGSGGAIINSSGTPASFGGNITLAGNTSIGGSGVFTLASGFSAIGGTGPLTKVGSGTVTLATLNTYTQGTVINGGGIIAAAQFAIPENTAVTINNAVLSTDQHQVFSSLTMDNGKLLGPSANIHLKGNVTASGVSQIETPTTLIDVPRTFTVAADSTLNVTGPLGGFGLDLIKAGTGTMVFTSSSTGLFEYKVNAGTLHTTGSGDLNASVTVESAGHLRLDSTGVNNLQTVTINSSTISGSGGFTNSGNVASTGTSFIKSPVQVGGPINVINGELTISGATNGAFINKQGVGTLTLTNDGNVQNGIYIGAGAVQIGDGGTTGVPGNGNIELEGGEFVINRSNAFTIANNITSTFGTGALRHKGTGATTLTGANSYGSPTFIDNGTLVIATTHAGAGAYTVGPNGSLAGNGAVSVTANQSVTIQGNVSPGTSAGNLTLQTFGTGVTELAQGGSYTWEINNEAGTPGTAWDVLTLDAVSVTANSGANNTGGFTIRITSLPGIVWTNTVGNRVFTIATSSDQSFAGVDLDKFKINTDNFAASNLGGFYLKIGNNNGFGVNGDSLDLIYVPEPSSVMAMLAIAGGTMLRRRRRRA
ncbi:MAG: autotransporter-associated beta strand repeat-containing protein [Anaerolineae bacterium]|nr:autotransporter-associated beta strand repeat-containing protein [Phycisphaerae bacterium]